MTTSQPYYTGSCTCGAIRYRVHLPTDGNTHDLKKTATKCNCTYCQKPGCIWISMAADPLSTKDFVLESPAAISDVAVYRGKRARAIYEEGVKLQDDGGHGEEVAGKLDAPRRYLCRECGCHVWAQGRFTLTKEHTGADSDMVYRFFSVNLNTLDQPQEGLELKEWKVGYMDGLGERWGQGVREEPWEGSVV